MKNNDSLNKNLEKLISLHGEEQKMDEQQKNKIIENLTNNTQTQIPATTHFWRKIAIAAIIILVPAILAIYLRTPPEQKIEIPPELAAMSIEELIKLNYDSSQNSFDPNIVKYALKQALEKVDSQEVIKIAKGLESKEFQMNASLMAPPVHPIEHLSYARKTFPEVVEESNLFIQARLLDYHLNLEDIIAAIVDKEIYGGFELFMSKYNVEMQLYIIDCLPENVLKKGKTVTIQTVLYEEQLDAIKKNTDYYFAMVKDTNKEPHFLEYFSGVYPVDINKPANIEMRQFFKDAQDVFLFGQSPKPEIIEYWVSTLQGDTYLLALEYMNILPDDLLPADSIMNALEQRYSDYILVAASSEEEMSKIIDREERIKISNELYNLKHNNIPLFEKTMSLLLRSGDIDSMKRMLSLVEEDIKDIERGIIMGKYGFNSREYLPLILSTVVASEEDNFKDSFVETYIKVKKYCRDELLSSMQTTFARDLTVVLINQISKLPLKEAQPMLLKILENSTEFGLYDVSDCRKIWALLSSSKEYDVRSHLEDFLFDPNLSKIGIERIRNGENIGLSVFSFEQAAFETLRVLPESVRPGHDELINFLLMIYERNKLDQSCINFTVNTFRDILEPTDTKCLPVIKELLSVDRPNWSLPQIITQRMPNQALVSDIITAIDNKKVENKASLIETLFACGEKGKAIEMALKMAEEPLREDNSRNLLDDLRLKADLVLVLGKTQRTDLVPLIDQYTREDNIDKYRNISEDLVGRLIGYTVDNLLQNSIMAMARLGGKSSIPRLREIYNTTDDIRAKIVSSVALYYNGDKTGEKLLRHFVEGTYLSIPEINMRWGDDISDGTVFQDVIKSYLRNELTDALLLEKLTYYLDRADTNIETDFFSDHRKEILNIAVEQLESRNLTTRQYALEILLKATGLNYGFDSGRYAGQQEDIIQQWREYLKSYDE